MRSCEQPLQLAFFRICPELSSHNEQSKVLLQACSARFCSQSRLQDDTMLLCKLALSLETRQRWGSLHASGAKLHHLDIFGIQGNCLSSILYSTAIGFHTDVCKRSVCMVDSAQGVAVNGFAITLDC